LKRTRFVFVVMALAFGLIFFAGCTEKSSTPTGQPQPPGVGAGPGSPPPPPGGVPATTPPEELKMQHPLKGDACMQLCGRLCPFVTKCRYNDYKKADVCVSDCKEACKADKIPTKYQDCEQHKDDCAQLEACLKKADEEDRVTK